MKILKTLDDIFVISACKQVIVCGIMDTKIFWRLYFWWGIRQAKKRRLSREKYYLENSDKYRISLDEFWDNNRNDK